MSSAKAACQIAAKKLAKYSDPKLPWSPFGTFYGPKDNSYVKTGIVLIEEPEAQFQNGFGAMVHSTVTCRYDLNSKQVVSANVSAN
jgi:hypothetical protein